MPTTDEYESIEDRAPESLLKRLLLDAAGQAWGTTYGRLKIRGQINAEQYGACKWFDDLYAKYLQVLERPRGIRTSTGEAYSKGHPPDPFSPVGLKIAADEVKIVKAYESARMAGMGCGKASFEIFWRGVIDGFEPVGYQEISAFSRVSVALAAHRNRARNNRRRSKR